MFLAVIVANLVKGAASCFRCLALGAGCMMFATQLVRNCKHRLWFMLLGRFVGQQVGHRA